MKKALEIIKEIKGHTGHKSLRQLSLAITGTPGLFYDITGGKVDSITDRIASKIVKKYPEIDEEYLLTGEGTLLKESPILASSDQLDTKEGITPIPYDDYMMVEYEDLSTAAGHLGLNDPAALPDTKKRLVPREFENGKYLVVRVDGHSMDNGTSISIPDGTEILIRQLKLDQNTRLPIRNNLFVIVSKEGVVFKQIIEHNSEEGYLKCHSYNPSFKDYKIPLTDVLQIFIYRKIVSFRPPIPDIEK